MISTIIFSNSEWFWPAFGCCLVLWIVYAWKERLLLPRLKFYLHSFIALIAVVCLFFMVLRPQVSVSKEAESLILLTEGFNQDRLDSLSTNYPNIDVSSYQAGIPIVQRDKTPKNIFLLGHGVRPYDLWQFDSIKTQFLKEAELKGISKLKYSPSVTLGNEVVFKGEYREGKVGRQLYLLDAGGNELDSIGLIGEEKQQFALSTIPKVSGSFLFSISEKDSLGNLLSNDPVPVEVSEEKNLKIWIVNAFPSFETKYLKNFLSELGHEVTVRSRLTKGRFKYEYFNVGDRKAINFNEAPLSEVDLVIMDVATLKGMSRNSLNTIEGVVREEGLGVFIQPDESMFGSSLPLGRFQFRSNNLKEVKLDQWPRIGIPSSGFEFRSDSRLETVITKNERVFAAYKKLGAGRVGTTTFLGTYEILLQGNVEIYQEIWSQIFQSVGKNFIPEVSWKSRSFPSYANEPFSFELRTRVTEPQVLLHDEVVIPLEQDITNNRLWRGSFYPKKTGWHRLSLKEDSIQTHQLYVQDTAAWTTLRNYDDLTTNERYFQASEVEETQLSSTYSPISLLWIFILFLLCSGYLWLAPKL